MQNCETRQRGVAAPNPSEMRMQRCTGDIHLVLISAPRAMVNCYCDWAAAEEDLEILGPQPLKRRSVPRPCQQL